MDIHALAHVTLDVDIKATRLGVRYDADLQLSRITLASPDITISTYANATQLAEILADALLAMESDTGAIGRDALVANPRLMEVLQRAAALVAA